jgi:hypothetical protein
MSAKDFQEYARECLASAARARSPSEREVFLQLAQTWMQAARLDEVQHSVSQPGEFCIDRPARLRITRI